MRTILISGASSGIGLKIAHKQLEEGNRVSAGIRDLESLEGSIIDPRNWPNEQLILNKYDALDKNSPKSFQSFIWPLNQVICRLMYCLVLIMDLSKA